MCTIDASQKGARTIFGRSTAAPELLVGMFLVQSVEKAFMMLSKILSLLDWLSQKEPPQLKKEKLQDFAVKKYFESVSFHNSQVS